jgi:predicted DNA-binding transcriptional regulator YafY
MKIDRLLGIVVLLLSKKKVTAKELSVLFEVSERTIYRDVDTINLAGIPITTQQGSGGGISIMSGFTMDRQTVNI